MLNRIKKRLIHFSTDGRSIVSDFVSARQKRAGAFRRVVHACFYFQCAAALVCAVCGFVMGGALTGAILAVGAAASAGAALIAVSGDFAVRTISYVLNMVYAVICFIVGGGLFTLCGVLMLVSAAAALVGFAAGYFRSFLLEYSPLKLTPEDYTLTGAPEQLPQDEPQEQTVDELPPEPARKSELLLIAEQVSQIMNAPRIQPGEQTQQGGAEVQRELNQAQDEAPVVPQADSENMSGSTGTTQDEENRLVRI